MDQAFFLGRLVQHDHVLRGDDLLGDLVDHGRVELREDLLDQIIGRLRLHVRRIVEEIADQFGNEFRIAARFGLVGRRLVTRPDVFLGTGHFVFAEAETFHLLDFRQVGGQGRKGFAFPGDHIAHDDFHGFTQVADRQVCREVRGVRLGRDVAETLGHHLAHDPFQQVLHQADRRAVVLFRHGLALPEDFPVDGGLLRIGQDAHERLLVVRDGDDFLRLRILLGRDVREDFRQLGLDIVHVHITNHHDGLHGRVIPGLVEIHQAFRLEIQQVLLAANQRATAIFRVSVIIGEAPLMQTPGGVAAGTALLDDDPALLVDLGGIVGHEMGVIVQDQQAGINHALTDQRDVVEHVLGLLDAGGSIDIAAEGSTDALEPVQDAFLREILRAIEAHVLQEVGEAVLVRGLLDGADVGGQVEFRPSLRLFIVTDVIGQAIVQLPFADGGIIRKLRHLLGTQEKGSGQNGSKGKEDFLHSECYCFCKDINNY